MNSSVAVLFVAFLILLVLSVPIAISVGLSSAVMVFQDKIPFEVIVQRMFTSIDSSPFGRSLFHLGRELNGAGRNIQAAHRFGLRLYRVQNGRIGDGDHPVFHAFFLHLGFRPCHNGGHRFHYDTFHGEKGI